MRRCIRCGQPKHHDNYLFPGPGGSGATTAFCRRYIRRAPFWLRWWTGTHVR